MKKLTILFLFISIALFAQTTTDNYDTDTYADGSFHFYNNSLSLDSAGTSYSQTFTGNSSFYAASDTSYHVELFYYTQTADSVNYTVSWLVNGTHPDSLNHWQEQESIVTVTSNGAGKTSFKLSGRKAPFNKVKLVNNAGSKAQTISIGFLLK